MAVNFPDTPDIGQQFETAGKLYIWDGNRWTGRVGAPEVPAIPEDIRVSEIEDSVFDPNRDGTDNYIDTNASNVEIPEATLGLVVNQSGNSNERVLKDSGSSLGYYPQTNTLKTSKLLVTNFNVPNAIRNNLLIDENGMQFGPAGNPFFGCNPNGLTHIGDITAARFRTASRALNGPSGKLGKITEAFSGRFGLNGQNDTDIITGFDLEEANSLRVYVTCWGDDGTSTITTEFEARRVQNTMRIIDERNNIVDIPNPAPSLIILPNILPDPTLGIWVAYNGPVPGLSVQFGVFKRTAGPAITGNYKFTTEVYTRD